MVLAATQLGWPPTVFREQSMRDVMVLLEAAASDRG